MKYAILHILLLCWLSGCAGHNIHPGQGRTNLTRWPLPGAFLLRTAELADGVVQEQTGMAVAVYAGKERCVLLTSSHLVHGAGSLRVAPWSGAAGRPDEVNCYAEARSIYECRDLDAALIEIPATTACITAIPADTDPAPGIRILTMGQPVQGQSAMTRGIVSGYWPVDGLGRLMVSDILTTPGFSGSGVFLANGRLAGIVNGKTGDPRRGFAYIIPISRLRVLLAKAGRAGANQETRKEEVQHDEQNGQGKEKHNDPGAAASSRRSAER